MTRIDTAAMYARVAALIPSDPFGPVDYALEHRVTLPAPSSEDAAVGLWDRPQDWCRAQMKERGGEKWSRHRDPETGNLLFTFTEPSTAIHFKLRFS